MAKTSRMMVVRGAGWVLAVTWTLLAIDGAAAAAPEGVAKYRDKVEPILVDACFSCHADGLKKGNVAFDGFTSDEAIVGDRAFWWGVLKNVRAGVMPPSGKPRPSDEQLAVLEDWIKREVFHTNPADPDPGRVTIRRLNRIEYRNTIRDLTGVDFRTDEEFPPDDTGYGFDNIGDVLTVSPLLLEKYLQAAEWIVAKGVPTIARVVPSKEIPGSKFRGDGVGGEHLAFSKAAKVTNSYRAEHEGTYKVGVEMVVRGPFDFDPGRCKVTFQAGEKTLLAEEYKWEDGKKFRYEFTESWKPGMYPLSFQVEPLTGEKNSPIDLRVVSVVVEGPMEKEHWGRPKGFERFFSKDAPEDEAGREAYAREVIGKFGAKAYRRPLDARTLDRLVGVAREVYKEPGKTFEAGMAEAMIVMLASPRFLFRVEEVAPKGGRPGYPLVDEYALASRLSYFLWSTMPDEALFKLASRGELRANLDREVARMMADPKSSMLVRNFTGQWLQARDVEGIAVDAREVLARDRGDEKALKAEREAFKAFLAEREAASVAKASEVGSVKKGQQAVGAARRSGKFANLFGPLKADLDAPLREAMRRETEMAFGEVVKKDRSVLELLDADYTFVNERLAKHYGIPDVKGEQMRRVTLPPESPRGGILTQGTVLLVTSNPTRTSPVKRGLFVLDNILGTPPPPPPADVPQLEDSEKAIDGHEPSLREVLAMHRTKPLCNSCHSRMDPLGLALENFNAMGLWRETERGQPLYTAGTLITGEKFTGIRDLKAILKGSRRRDFYRCLTEKLMTYALGRGLEATDVESVDRVVDQLDRDGGRFSSLLSGVIASAPFQKRRDVSDAGGREAAVLHAKPEAVSP